MEKIVKILMGIVKFIVAFFAMLILQLGMTYFIIIDPKNAWLKCLAEITEDRLFLVPLGMIVVGISIIFIIVKKAFDGKNILISDKN